MAVRVGFQGAEAAAVRKLGIEYATTMLELAHKKYYRWKEVSGWEDVTSYGHPVRSEPDPGQETTAG